MDELEYGEEMLAGAEHVLANATEDVDQLLSRAFVLAHARAVVLNYTAHEAAGIYKSAAEALRPVDYFIWKMAYPEDAAEMEEHERRQRGE